MNLKTATILAIGGASVSVIYQILSLIARFVQPLGNVLWGGGGAFVSVLFTLVSASYLIFFITLYRKQQ